MTRPTQSTDVHTTSSIPTERAATVPKEERKIKWVARAVIYARVCFVRIVAVSASVVTLSDAVEVNE